MIDKTQHELGQTAGLDALFDRFRVGAISGYRDLLNIDFEEVAND